MNKEDKMEKLQIELTYGQKELLAAINEKNLDALKKLLPNAQFNFHDENGMTPLEHACYKDNVEAVQIMLDMGADVHYNKHGAGYTALHFAALSGNVKIVRLLLDAGIDANTLNNIKRTAAQMAAFVGNHDCVETINNYVKRETLEYYTIPQGQQTEPLIPPTLLPAFHEFVIAVNLHPVRVVMNLHAFGLHKHLPGVQRALELMCEKEMKKAENANELLALKFHYLRWQVEELIRVQQHRQESATSATGVAKTANNKDKNVDYIEMFIKRILKENKQGQLDYMEYVIREAIREFPYWECSVFVQVAQQLAAKEPLPALTVLSSAINGQRGFAYEISNCSACGNEKPDKKCSKCKLVEYCDRECQRLHWSMHKKTCARPVSNAASVAAAAAAAAAASATITKGPIDTTELSAELSKLQMVKNNAHN